MCRLYWRISGIQSQTLCITTCWTLQQARKEQVPLSGTGSLRLFKKHQTLSESFLWLRVCVWRQAYRRLVLPSVWSHSILLFYKLSIKRIKWNTGTVYRDMVQCISGISKVSYRKAHFLYWFPKSRVKQEKLDAKKDGFRWWKVT